MLWHRSAAVSYQGTQCDFSSVTMICDLSGVAGRDPLHINKPAAAVVAHPPLPLVCVVDHKPTTHISSPSPTYCPPPPLVCVVDHKPTTHISSPSPTYCPLQIFDFLISNIMIVPHCDSILSCSLQTNDVSCCFRTFILFMGLLVL